MQFAHILPCAATSIGSTLFRMKKLCGTDATRHSPTKEPGAAVCDHCAAAVGLQPPVVLILYQDSIECPGGGCKSCLKIQPRSTELLTLVDYCYYFEVFSRLQQPVSSPIIMVPPP